MKLTSPKPILVFGNEKGGAGKSTVAMHTAVALLHKGLRLAYIDLDLRQRTLAHFFSNRALWLAANDRVLPQAFEPDLGDQPQTLLAMSEAQAQDLLDQAIMKGLHEADIVLIDTPGGDTHLSRRAHALADVIITPMNDSFIDFDLLGQVDPVSLEVKKPSIYAETVWAARKTRAIHDGGTIDWVVLRNRLASADPKNRRRVDERVRGLSKRVGFRMAQGLRDRVIYRELFPFGLTVSDLSADIRPVAISLAHIAARHELQYMLSELGLDVFVPLPEDEAEDQTQSMALTD
jgi:chromosome partitioning protein